MAITYVTGVTDGGNSTDTASLTVPGGITDGDLLIGMASISSGTISGISWTQPTGWTEIDDFDATHVNDARFCLAYKIASSESGTWDWVATDATHRVQASVAVYNGVDQADPLDVAWVRANHYKAVDNLPSSSTNTSAAAITTVTDAAWVVLFNFISHNDVTAMGPPSGYTERLEYLPSTDAFRGHHVCDKPIPSITTETPGDYTHTENATAINDSSMFTFAIKPAATGTTPHNPFGLSLQGPFGGPLG